jgi:drug/metabolite transporter (DMT)-like permease
MGEVARAPRAKIVLAFAAIYLIWGSTYLAIRFAIETLPPFLMAGARFVTAGVILYAVARARGAGRPSRVHWFTAFVVGSLLLLGGNGGVVWAEQRVPSGVAALLVALVPCWMVLMDWLRPSGSRPAPQVFIGLVLGILGLAWLVGPDAIMGGGRVDLVGALVLGIASLSWAAGSIYSRHSPSASSPLLSIGMQQFAGGVSLLVFGLLVGEAGRLDLAAVSTRSLLAFLYLIAFGSIIGFSAYMWLLRVSTPARVSTYAYVNPIVAVVLGWALAGEPLTARIAVAAAVIVTGVALITLTPKKRNAGQESAERGGRGLSRRSRRATAVS